MAKREYLTVQQAAELLGVTDRTIWRLVDRGELELRTFKSGARRKFRKSDVRAHVRKRIRTLKAELKSLRSALSDLAEPE